VIAKVDFKRDLDCYKAKRDTPQVVTVPDLQYLMIDGHGDPNTPAFAEATATLYPVAYKLKFTSKKTLGRDYVVMPLEGLWWAGDMESFTDARDKTQWDWTLMIMIPDWITHDVFTEAVEQVAAKHRPARLNDLRRETLAEGLRPGPPHRHIRQRGRAAPTDAPRVHPQPRPHDGREAPRGLPERRPQG